MVEPLLSLPRSSLDETIEERCCMQGDQYGIWAQFLQAILVSFAWFFDAQQTFISAFTDAQPSWHCTSPPSSYCNSFSISNNFCNLPKGTWAWNLPAQTSVISEWSLQCDGSFITGFPASSFFMGCLTVLPSFSRKRKTLQNAYLYASLIGGLPNLEYLKLKWDSDSGEWCLGDITFHKLKFLKLSNLDIYSWEASEASFPLLETLVIKMCNILEEIPLSFADIQTLKQIDLKWCKSSLEASAVKIMEEVEAIEGCDRLDLIIHDLHVKLPQL